MSIENAVTLMTARGSYELSLQDQNKISSLGQEISVLGDLQDPSGDQYLVVGFRNGFFELYHAGTQEQPTISAPLFINSMDPKGNLDALRRQSDCTAVTAESHQEFGFLFCISGLMGSPVTGLH